MVGPSWGEAKGVCNLRNLRHVGLARVNGVGMDSGGVGVVGFLRSLQLFKSLLLTVHRVAVY